MHKATKANVSITACPRAGFFPYLPFESTLLWDCECECLFGQHLASFEDIKALILPSVSVRGWSLSSLCNEGSMKQRQAQRLPGPHI